MRAPPCSLLHECRDSLSLKELWVQRTRQIGRDARGKVTCPRSCSISVAELGKELGYPDTHANTRMCCFQARASSSEQSMLGHELCMDTSGEFLSSCLTAMCSGSLHSKARQGLM